MTVRVYSCCPQAQAFDMDQRCRRGGGGTHEIWLREAGITLELWTARFRTEPWRDTRAMMRSASLTREPCTAIVVLTLTASLNSQAAWLIHH
jgi:hypothetical protein